MKTRVFLLAVVASAVVAGCGGDSNEALSYDGFADAANEVCTSATASIDEAAEGLSGDPENDAPIYDELIPALEDANNEFADLDPPEELQASYDEFTAIIDQQVEGARDAQGAAQDGDTAEYQRILEALGPLDEQADVAASKLGAADCLD